MKVLFINPQLPQCGVHQYGKRFFSIMAENKQLECVYHETGDNSLEVANKSDVVIYNVHPGIRNICLVAPLPMVKAKQIGLWHEGPMNAQFDAWIVSDPSKESHTSINFIGRLLPECHPWHWVESAKQPPHVGVSGFLGAWAPDMVRSVLEQIPNAVIRLHLPYSHHMDPNGDMTRAAVESCRQISTDTVFDICNDFLTDDQLLAWLSYNDLNSYIRPHTGSLGVSSALDFALACHRPIAINKNPMFSYLHGCKPSICVEDRPLHAIIEDSRISLAPHWDRNCRSLVAKEILHVLQKVAS